MPWTFNPFTGNLDWSNTQPTLGTIATQNADAVNIDGGVINGTPIGTTTAAVGKFTKLDVGNFGTASDYGAGVVAYAATIEDNANAISGVQMTNSSTGTTADFRFAIFDTDKLHYLTAFVPGKNHTGTMFGMAKNTITGLMSNTMTGGTDRTLVVGTLRNSSVVIGTGNVTRVTVTGGGNVGIGTTSPSTKLHVAGPIRVQTYTVATVPSASTTGAGSMIYVTNPASSARPYWSDGTNWRDAVGTLLA